MCLRTVVQYKCEHKVYRGTTECYARPCPGLQVEVIRNNGDCPQCDGQDRLRSVRWCPVGFAIKRKDIPNPLADAAFPYDRTIHDPRENG
ncbi:hypothetical protein GQ602_004317 [Ophiocordyceps camponoti-floridani]|uniref:Uncharacterized protein n=1 Tax=Ophiocordyceps camponoti-floridani TaxID=2030778 RepID=A0A8H4Q6H7_9HYPO|nr:hypothetical protein GQ602_004317 [Ophiocordyceps camponoti-floridani]